MQRVSFEACAAALRPWSLRGEPQSIWLPTLVRQLEARCRGPVALALSGRWVSRGAGGNGGVNRYWATRGAPGEIPENGAESYANRGDRAARWVSDPPG